MYKVLIALGVLAWLYFAVLAVKRVNFCIIWLPLGCLFLAAGFYLRYCRLHPQGFRLPAPLAAALGVAGVLALALFVAVESRIVLQMCVKPQPDLEYLIVLGAQVKGDRPSLALKRRLDGARVYLEENPQTRAVLSGGQGADEKISEAQCMKEYLTAAGIDPSRLLMEDRSTTTMENLKFSAEVIAHDGGEKTDEIGILTNNFHVHRALLLARRMGYTEVSGIAARSDWKLQAHYLVREFFALMAEKIHGNI